MIDVSRFGKPWKSLTGQFMLSVDLETEEKVREIRLVDGREFNESVRRILIPVIHELHKALTATGKISNHGVI